MRNILNLSVAISFLGVFMPAFAEEPENVSSAPASTPAPAPTAEATATPIPPTPSPIPVATAAPIPSTASPAPEGAPTPTPATASPTPEGTAAPIPPTSSPTPGAIVISPTPTPTVSPQGASTKPIEKAHIPGYMIPASEVLSQNLLKTKVEHSYKWGNVSLDSAGKQVILGYDVTGWGGNLSLEYGITDNFTVGIKAPIVGSFTAKANGAFDSKFDFDFDDALLNDIGGTYEDMPGQFATIFVSSIGAQLAEIATSTSTVTATVSAKKVLNEAGCTSVSTCRTAIESGKVQTTSLTSMGGKLDFGILAQHLDAFNDLTTKIGMPENIPTNSTFSTADIAAKIAAPLAIYKQKARDTNIAAIKAKKAASGIGDLELMVKFGFSTPSSPLITGVPFYGMVALGSRLNTSGYTTATKNSKIPSGRGTTDFLFRAAIDCILADGLMLSIENQSEKQILKGKIYQNGSIVDFERSGLRNVGFGKLTIGPGAWIDSLSWLSLNSRIAYDLDSATKPPNPIYSGAPLQTFLGLGMGINLQYFEIPAAAEFLYSIPALGKNVTESTNAMQSSVSFTYQF